jgi:hypothetical protein
LKGSDVLEMQLSSSFYLLDQRLADVSGNEWTRRVIPGTSLPGFVLWHAARTIDWAIQCGIRGVAEIASASVWEPIGAGRWAYGAGISDVEADEVASATSADLVRRYLAAIKTGSLEWLASQTDDDLDRVPDLEGHSRIHPRYVSESVWAEVGDLAGRPAWQILARPCISHVRVHVGEFDTLLMGLRVKALA